MRKPLVLAEEEDYAIAGKWLERQRARELLRDRRDALREKQGREVLLAVGDHLGQ